MYLMLTYATYVALAVLASSLMFGLAVGGLALAEAVRVARQKVPRRVRRQEAAPVKPPARS